MARPVKPKRKPRTPELDPEASTIIDEIYHGTVTTTSDAAVAAEPELKKIERTKQRKFPKRLFIMLGIIIVLVAATVAGFYTFNSSTTHFNDQSVVVTIDAPATVVSAGPATYTVTVTNNESVGTKNAELSLSFPDGWSYTESNPKPSDGNNTLWELGTIPAHGKKTATITGTITGEVGSVATFNATVTYRPTNFNYDFTSKASASVTIGSSIISLDLKGPAQATSGSVVRYVLTYTNTSNDTLNDLRLVATFPDGFSIKSSDPKPRDGNNVWAVNQLKSGANGTITIDGSFKGSVGDSQQLTFDAELKQGTAFERQVETTAVVQLIDATLNLAVTANKAKGPSLAVNPGDSIAFEIQYTNASDLEITNATVTATISGSALDAATFSDDFGATMTNGKVTWDVSKVPALASIDPGTSGTIRFTLKAPDGTTVTTGPALAVQAAISASNGTGSSASTVKATAETLTVKVSSKPTLTTEARYYDMQGATVGSGALPPTVNQTTTYRIYWTVTNTTNDLTDMTVTATVPPTVYWTGKNVSTTAGSIAFDSTQRQITWRLNRLPASAGIHGGPITASFDLSVTPGPSDVGTSPQLTSGAAFSAVDSFSGATLKLSRDPLTTDLLNDTQAAGKGVVVGQ